MRIGTMGWSYDFWRGSFYPKDLAPSEFLTYYSKQFDTVEVDSTFYRIPREQTVRNWKKQTTPHFTFSFKFPRIITHIKMLENCQEETRVFLERLGLLNEKVGPLLLQLPPTFGSNRMESLNTFLKSLPKEHSYAVEVRNREALNERLYSILNENKVALTWVDSSSLSIVDGMTAGFVYVRLEGDRKRVNGTLGKTEVDCTPDIRHWVDILKSASDKGTEIFVYFSKYYSGLPTSDVREFLKLTGS